MRQQQDRIETLLLVVAQEQRNIDTKITRLEHNFDASEQRRRSNTYTRQ